MSYNPKTNFYELWNPFLFMSGCMVMYLYLIEKSLDKLKDNDYEV